MFSRVLFGCVLFPILTSPWWGGSQRLPTSFSAFPKLSDSYIGISKGKIKEEGNNRACWKHGRMPNQRILFCCAVLKNLEIHNVFPRFFALLNKKTLAIGRDFVRKFLPKLFVKSAECDWIAGNFNISEDYNMEKSIFKQMGGTYRQQDDYLLPNLTVPETILIGVWGQRHLRYLKLNRQTIYTAMLLSGELNSYLTEIDLQAEDMFSQLVKQMAEQEGITEQLKTDHQMEWVGRMNNIRNRATEIVNDELIFS